MIDTIMNCMVYWFGLGCLGGIANEFVTLYRVRHGSIPFHLKGWFYWTITSIGIVLGGTIVVVYAHTENNMNSFLAFYMGGTSIMSLERLFSTAPNIGKGEIN